MSDRNTYGKYCLKCLNHYSSTLEFCPQDGLALMVESIAESKESQTVDKYFLNKYKIIQQIGSGGMCVVYKTILNESPYAVKLLHPKYSTDAVATKRLYREFKILEQLDHQSIVRAIESGRTPEGQLFLVLEYLSGITLKKFIKEKKRLSYNLSVNILLQIVDGIIYIHEKNLLHRDLKPENIMIIENSYSAATDTCSIKLFDFGTTRSILTTGQSEHLTRSQVVLGTPGYMSPEQRAGNEPDPRSDIYSLGVIFYECLSGKLPHTENLQLPEKLPLILKKILTKTLQNDPSNRYQNLAVLKIDLEKAATVLNVIALKSKSQTAQTAEVIKRTSDAAPQLTNQPASSFNLWLKNVFRFFNSH